MVIHLFNTLTRRSEIFKPLGKTVGIYTCGPTVYNFAHIGNLRTYLFEDLLVRTLLYNNYILKRVMNITDVGHLTSDADTGEDKMELGSKREGKSIWDIALFYTEAFKHDLEKLNILSPDIWCNATNHIKEQIAMIQELEKKGFTYIIPRNGVYYDTSLFKTYGALAKLNIEGLKAGARVDVVKGKRNITDFALWKFQEDPAKKREMEWQSPWGTGFPGWHIECSAMSRSYLGDQFDIHCGGIDHIPVHHTNEIAQTEGATGKKWVSIWMHSEFLTITDAKMAKSGNNFITIQTLIDKGYDPLDYRYFVLGAHYRSKLNFSWDALTGARNTRNNLKNHCSAWHDAIHAKKAAAQKDEKNNSRIAKNNNTYKQQFLDAINNDLDTPIALSVLWALIKDKNVSEEEKYSTVLDFDKVLGLKLDENKDQHSIPLSTTEQELIKKRDLARKNKEWKSADLLRQELLDNGILVEDAGNHSTWKRV